MGAPFLPNVNLKMSENSINIILAQNYKVVTFYQTKQDILFMLFYSLQFL